MRCSKNGRYQTVYEHQTRKGKAAKIAALPYDVYNRKEATVEVEKNPESFLKIDRAETGYPLSVDMYDEKVYQRAHDLLWGW